MSTPLDKYIKDLQEYNDAKPGDFFVIYDHINGVDRKIDAKNVIAVSDPSSNYQWRSSVEYAIDEIVEYNGKWWRSIVNGNEGNIPTEDLGYWEVVNKSASGFVMWTAGYFTQTEAYVLNYLDGYLQFFRLSNATRPFESTDFELEYAQGDWELASERGYIGIYKPAHGFAENNVLTNVAGTWVKYNGINGKPLAIVKSVINTELVIVVLLGERIKTFSGLTPGAVYYAQTDGTISTTISTDAVLVATSATEAIVLLGGGGGGTVSLGPLFPDTYFCAPAPFGNDATGMPGDMSKPYTPVGAVAAASAGKKVAFLPGQYNISQNIAKDGVSYSTFGGDVTIEVTGSNVTLFDYRSSASTQPIFISGLFFYILNGSGCAVFRFNDSVAQYRSHFISFVLMRCLVGSLGMQFPRFSTAASFEGQIDVDAAYTGFAMSTPASSNTATSRAGVINMKVNNMSAFPGFSQARFSGYIVQLNYYSNNTAAGFANEYSNVDNCVWTLNIVQLAGTLSRMPSGGTFNVSFTGGQYEFRNSAKIQIDGAFKNAEIIFSVTTGVYLSGRIDTCIVRTPNVDKMVISAVSNSMTLEPTNCILYGHHTDMDLTLDRARGLKIMGTVIMKNDEYLALDANHNLEVSANGKVIGNVATGLIRMRTGANNKCLIAGQVRNKYSTNATGAAIQFADPTNVELLIMRGATIQVDAAATNAIDVAGVAAPTIKMYGDSYMNKPIGGTNVGIVNYAVGSSANFIVDADVEVLDF